MKIRSHIPARPSIGSGFSVDAVICYPAKTLYEYLYIYGSSLTINWKEEESSLQWRRPPKILECMTDSDLKDIIYHKRNIQELDAGLKEFEYQLSIRSGGKQKYDKESDRRLLEEKKATISIIDIVESYIGGNKYRRGRLIQCPLPNHKDGTASMKLYEKDNRFKCFGCQAGGSQVDFIMLMEECSVQNAIIKFTKF